MIYHSIRFAFDFQLEDQLETKPFTKQKNHLFLKLTLFTLHKMKTTKRKKNINVIHAHNEERQSIVSPISKTSVEADGNLINIQKAKDVIFLFHEIRWVF